MYTGILLDQVLWYYNNDGNKCKQEFYWIRHTGITIMMETSVHRNSNGSGILGLQQ